ncbi:MAG: sugar phosphate isomerase/epimerase family protein [Hominicoprocola sp.]
MIQNAESVKLGCCAPIEQYGEVAAAGFDYIELPGNVLARLSLEEFGQWEKTVQGGAIPCMGLNASLCPEVKICGPMFSENAAEQYARLLCSRAACLGVSKIGVGSPASRALPQGFPVDTAWKQAERFLRIFCAAALPYGIEILWEPLNPEETGFGVDSLESAEHIAELRAAGVSNLGLVADLYHMARKGEDAEVLAQLMPYVRHVHIASAQGGRGYVTETDAAVMKPLLERCAGRTAGISAETFSGRVCAEGADYVALLHRWLREIESQEA